MLQYEKKQDEKIPHILVLEPYYGGSHKAFLQDLATWLPWRLDSLTLPARKWKWRMRLAAPYFAEKLKKFSRERYRNFTAILCSTFVDVATFRSMAPSWTRNLPLHVYFHENQFAYPVQADDERDFHFALTNFTTALAADRLAFNSCFNMESFLNGVRDLMKISPDMKLDGYEEVIRRKSVVIHPGIDFSGIDAARQTEENDRSIPTIVWNHRWEHDKNPELFFKTLYRLDEEGIDFSLVVLGESFKRKPQIFEDAKKRLSRRILHFGYVESRQEYYSLLKKCSLVVSTAVHEFFGISVIEAVRSGCRPLLPSRLSYPELFPDRYLYADDIDFLEHLKNSLAQGPLSPATAVKFTEPFSWVTLEKSYREWFAC